jgi:hypothetical protein
MKVVYAQQGFLPSVEESPIFLVGPTPRSSEVKSWRPEALAILHDAAFQGPVYVPEPEDGDWGPDYTHQIEWEHKALEHAAHYGCIAAWVPRNLKTMPAFTTNVEFGLYLRSPRFVYGRPPNAPNCRYLDYMYEHVVKQKPPHQDLRSLLIQAVAIADTDLLPTSE